MRWYHYKTRHFYEVIGFGLNEATLTPVVIYRQVGENGPMWVRPCAEFFDGRFRQVLDGIEEADTSDTE